MPEMHFTSSICPERVAQVAAWGIGEIILYMCTEQGKQDVGVKAPHLSTWGSFHSHHRKKLQERACLPSPPTKPATQVLFSIIFMKTLAEEKKTVSCSAQQCQSLKFYLSALQQEKLFLKPSLLWGQDPRFTGWDQMSTGPTRKDPKNESWSQS